MVGKAASMRWVDVTLQDWGQSVTKMYRNKGGKEAFLVHGHVEINSDENALACHLYQCDN